MHSRAFLLGPVVNLDTGLGVNHESHEIDKYKNLADEMTTGYWQQVEITYQSTPVILDQLRV